MADGKVGGLLLAAAGAIGLRYALSKRKPGNGEVPKCPVGKVWDEAIQDCVDKAPPPNLFLDIVPSLGVSPETVIVGDDVALTFKVTNLGDAYSPLWRVKVHESAAIGTGDLIYDSGKVSRGILATNATVEEEFSYTTKQKPNDGRDVFLTLYDRDGSILAERSWRDAFRVGAIGEFWFVRLTVDGTRSLLKKSPGDWLTIRLDYRYKVSRRSQADIYYRIIDATGWVLAAVVGFDTLNVKTDDWVEIDTVRLPSDIEYGAYDLQVRVQSPLFEALTGTLPGALMIVP